MNDQTIDSAPDVLANLLRDSDLSGFAMASEPKAGALLRVLAASKPGGRFLEIGTGTGVGTAWLLAGMDETSHLDSVDNDDVAQAIARQHLAGDRRVAFHLEDGAQFLVRQKLGSYDLIYADSWPGKFTHLDVALSLLRVGGIYFIDDLLPQPSWPEGHAPKVPERINELSRRPSFASVKLAWSSGLMLLVRTNAG
jgi:predicted O-methyltransferase YrrM